MSAMPARVTELSEGALVGAASRSQRRAERRFEQKLARRDRQRWTLLGCSILASAFGLTVLILDMLH
jgi:hypothetical protein